MQKNGASENDSAVFSLLLELRNSYALSLLAERQIASRTGTLGFEQRLKIIAF